MCEKSITYKAKRCVKSKIIVLHIPDKKDLFPSHKGIKYRDHRKWAENINRKGSSNDFLNL